MLPAALSTARNIKHFVLSQTDPPVGHEVIDVLSEYGMPLFVQDL